MSAITTAILAIEATEAALSLAVSVGINVTKLQAMREENGGALTAEQRQALARDAQDAIDSILPNLPD